MIQVYNTNIHVHIVVVGLLHVHRETTVRIKNNNTPKNSLKRSNLLFLLFPWMQNYAGERHWMRNSSKTLDSLWIKCAVWGPT